MNVFEYKNLINQTWEVFSPIIPVDEFGLLFFFYSPFDLMVRSKLVLCSAFVRASATTLEGGFVLTTNIIARRYTAEKVIC